MPTALHPANVRTDQGAFDTWVVRLSGYLQLLESRLFSSGLHTLGLPPDQEQRLGYLRAYVGDALEPELLEAISRLTPAADQPMVRAQAAELEHLHPGFASRDNRQRLLDALTRQPAAGAQHRRDHHLLRGLNGEYIPPAPGGDLLRDGPGVLPTGRNIHALDPYRMPSPGAFERGRAIALNILESHRAQTAAPGRKPSP